MPPLNDFFHAEFVQICAHYCTAELARRIRALRGGFKRFAEDCAPLKDDEPTELRYLLQFRERHARAVDRTRRLLEVLYGKPGKN